MIPKVHTKLENVQAPSNLMKSPSQGIYWGICQIPEGVKPFG